MKKILAVMVGMMMVCMCFCAYAEAVDPAGRTPAPYNYVLGEEGGYEENLIFNGDVIISGENTQIIFSNCEFNGNIILTSNEGTRVMLLGCDVNGSCVFQNSVQEATMEYALPKFMTTAPVTGVRMDCAGSVIALGDFEIVVDGETYSMADSDLWADSREPEAGYVAYEGQEASYYIVAQWWENDEEIRLIVCEYDPTM